MQPKLQGLCKELAWTKSLVNLETRKPDKLQKLVHHLIRKGKKTRALMLVRQAFHFLAVDKKSFSDEVRKKEGNKDFRGQNFVESSMPLNDLKKVFTASKTFTKLSTQVVINTVKTTKETKSTKALSKHKVFHNTPSPFPKSQSYSKVLASVSQSNKVLSSLSIFTLALQKIRPFFHLRKARKAGVNIQVPAILPPQNQDSLAIQWLIQGAKAKKKKEGRLSFAYHLAQEIRLAALRPKESYAFQKREEGVKQIQANRNAARFRWW